MNPIHTISVTTTNGAPEVCWTEIEFFLDHTYIDRCEPCEKFLRFSSVRESNYSAVSLIDRNPQSISTFQVRS
jgi:hypothetical protein